PGPGGRPDRLLRGQPEDIDAQIDSFQRQAQPSAGSRIAAHQVSLHAQGQYRVRQLRDQLQVAAVLLDLRLAKLRKDFLQLPPTPAVQPLRRWMGPDTDGSQDDPAPGAGNPRELHQSLPKVG